MEKGRGNRRLPVKMTLYSCGDEWCKRESGRLEAYPAYGERKGCTMNVLDGLNGLEEARAVILAEVEGACGSERKIVGA